MPGTLEELRTFAVVLESRSFTAAGRRLGLTTNAVSLRVKKLESALGVSLLARTTRTVVATDEGRMFYARVSRILSELEEAEEELRPSSAGLRGTVRLAIPGPLASEPFFKRLKDLQDAHPKLCVQMRVTTGPIDLVAEGIDIAVVVGQSVDSSLVGRLLGRIQWVLAASPSYFQHRKRPRGPSELSDHRCLRLLASPPQDEWTLVDAKGREVVVPVRGSFEADDSRALAEAIHQGLGIGIRPLAECTGAPRTGRLVRVLPGHWFQPFDVFALIPKGRVRVPRVAACVEALRGAVARLA